MKIKFLHRIFTPSFLNESEHYNIFYLFRRLLELFSFLSFAMAVYSFFLASPRVLMLASLSFLAFSLSYLLMILKKMNVAALISVTFLMFLGLLSVYTGDGIHDTAIFLFPPFFLIASFLLKRITFLIISAVSLIGLLLIGFGELYGYIENKYSFNSNIVDLILLAVLGSATVLIIYLFNEYLQKILDYAQKNAQNYRKIFDSVKEAIVINDCESGKIIHVNESMLSMFGYADSEISGLKMESLYQKSEAFSFRSALEKAQENQHSQQNLYSIYGKKKNGSFFMVEVSLNLTIIDGARRVLTVIRDVDEKSKMEEKIQQNEKMIALGRLAGGIAHDFRNQLTGIMGCAELLKCELEKASQLEALDIIIQSAQQSTELTQQLLFFSRKGEVVFKTLSINEIVESTITILQRSIDKRILVSSHINHQIPMVYGDNGRIQNALLNLCLNARDAMPQGGSLKIKTDLVQINQEYSNRLHEPLPPNKYISVSVIDTGVGVPPELHHKIFEPFFTTKPVGKGTGIGLSAVYGTVKEHGGSIEVQSVLNGGSSFIMYFPAAEKNENDDMVSGPVMPDIVSIRRQKAIVIDDDPVVRMTISKMLTKIGLDVIPFSDGIAAIDYYKNFNKAIDIIFLDMNMPLISGVETFSKLKQINRDVSVYVISGFSDPEDLQAIIRSGIKGYIPKPFRIEVLIEAVKSSVHQHETNVTAVLQ